MRCFVIRGFGEKKDCSGRLIDFDRVDRELIAKAVERCGMTGGTTVQVVGAGQIHQDMFQLILQDDFVVCDITVHNANVFYELGVRHALRKKHTLLIKGTPTADATPFDIAGVRYLTYPVDDPQSALDALVESIKATLARDRVTDSPVFLMLPQLLEADVSRITAVPLSLTEEVQRAAARGDKGWLRVLAEDVRGETFERAGLRLVGRAQMSVNDFREGAKTWEAVRNGASGDLEANFALANAYERLYKQSGDLARLTDSNQALQRVLAEPNLTTNQRSEALALHGRNLKTLWRRGFAGLDSVEARREQATATRATEAYEAYRDAFNADLNHFFSGVAALQMGHILLSLASSPTLTTLFDDDAQKTKRYVDDLGEELASLRHVVRASISRALKTETGDDLVWAKISAIDLRFLSLPDPAAAPAVSALVLAYKQVVPLGTFFSDSVYGQMALFEQLGINAAAASAVMSALGKPEASGSGRRHVVVFSGHTVDKAGERPPAAPRFPAAKPVQEKARALIDAALADLQGQDGELTVLCSAAPGADILALEACRERKIPSWLCLPLEREVVGREVFRHFDDDWRNRFLALANAHAAPADDRTFIMNYSERLPEWLLPREGKGMTVWSRGNRWMLQQALAWGADKVTLLALWDHDENDLSPNGTAAMVRLAREAAMFVKLVDSRSLTAG